MNGDKTLRDTPRYARPSTAITREHEARLNLLVCGSKRIALNEMSPQLDMLSTQCKANVFPKVQQIEDQVGFTGGCQPSCLVELRPLVTPYCYCCWRQYLISSSRTTTHTVSDRTAPITFPMTKKLTTLALADLAFHQCGI